MRRLFPISRPHRHAERSAKNGFTSTRRSAEHGFRLLRRSAQQGFTLLEMLVALAVFSLAALALIRLQAVAVRSVADLDDRQLARITAHNLMVDVQTSPDILAPGEASGNIENGGRTWRWVRRVNRTGDAALLRVDISLQATSGATTTSLSFLRDNPS